MVDIENTNIGAHALLVTNEGKVILQQRDSSPGIVNPGLISLFGGTIKSGETVEEGLKRELLDELELTLDDYHVENMGVYTKTKELDGVDWVVNVFVINEVRLEDLRLNEGKGIVCNYPYEILKSEKLTRITQLVLQDYARMLKKNS